MLSRSLNTVCLTLLTIALASGGASAQFLERKTLSLDAAKKIAAAAEAEAAKNKWTMAIAVLDDGGHLIYLERMDGTQIGSIDVVQGKARTAVRGGLPVMLDGKAVGAIGVSGGDPGQDEQCAEAGLAALH